jgi:hypothetical protein
MLEILNKVCHGENGKTNHPDNRNAPPHDSPEVRKGHIYNPAICPSLDTLVLAGPSLLNTTTSNIYNPGSEDEHDYVLSFFPETTLEPNTLSPPPESINNEDNIDMQALLLLQQPLQQPPPPLLDQQVQIAQVQIFN